VLDRAPAREQREEPYDCHGDQTDGRSRAGRLTKDPQRRGGEHDGHGAAVVEQSMRSVAD
jgi:hypothetical protein